MATAYQTVVGLEVHVQLLTRTKLFCGCATTFGLPPNSAVCPVCLGLPGALPVLNRAAFHLALRAAHALHCDIAALTRWDRKNYYYPDLPKNYQISQYQLPFSTGGYLEIDLPEGRKRIGLIRVHLEEDAGKMLHDEAGGGQDSLVDLNRAGIPLCEIVSRPEISSPDQAKAYLEELRLLLRTTGVSNCEMQEGSLRVDANVNIRVPRSDGGVDATPIVEIKNLNSFRAVERAVRYEAERQFQEYLQRGKISAEISKATAGWDETRGVTVVQRRKEEAADYRYFPDPDLPPVHVEPDWLARAAAEVGELPAQRRDRWKREYQLSDYEARLLVGRGRALADYFEETARLCGDPKTACNWVANQVMQVLNDRRLEIEAFPITPAALAELLRNLKQRCWNVQRGREIFAEMLASGESATAIVARLGLDAEQDADQLRIAVRAAVAANPKAAADVRAGKLKALDALVGAVMRQTHGKAPSAEVRRMLVEELQPRE